MQTNAQKPNGKKTDHAAAAAAAFGTTPLNGEYSEGYGPNFPKSAKNPDGFGDAPPEPAAKKKTGPRGRQDQGQPAAITMEPLVAAMPDLIQLHQRASSAATDYADAIKGAAEKSGLLAATVRRYVDARSGDNFVEAKEKSLQLALVFESVVP